jgi:hypothetical protein
MRKTIVRIAAALTVLAFATPVLACGDKATTASTEKSGQKGSAKVATAEKAPAKGAPKTSTAAN